MVRDKKWSGSTHELHEVDHVGANGAYFCWVGGFEEVDDAVDIFFVVDAGDDPKLGGAGRRLDCSKAVAVVWGIASYLRIIV